MLEAMDLPGAAGRGVDAACRRSQENRTRRLALVDAAIIALDAASTTVLNG